LKKIAFSGLFEQKFTMGSYGVGIEHAWCCRKAWEKPGSRVPKKKSNFFSLPRSCPNNEQPKFGFKEF
jgi:hypothetical protein